MDNAFERARAAYGTGAYDDATLEFLFPQLKESEDERIRKEIVSALKFANVGGIYDKHIAYLEKQKEQKPNIELIQRSWYMEGYHDREFGKEPKWILTTGEGGPKHELNPRYGEPLEQKPAEWDDKDEKVYNYLKSGFEYASNNPKLLNSLLSGASDATVQDYRNFIDKLKILRPQPMQEWSDEDEHRRTDVIYFLESAKTHYADTIETEKLVTWLKSLRPQHQKTHKQIIHGIYEMLKDKDFSEITPQHRVSLLNDIRVKCKHADEWAEILDEPSWKPSEEQMEALKETSVSWMNEKMGNVELLKSLYDQLKKLM